MRYLIIFVAGFLLLSGNSLLAQDGGKKGKLRSYNKKKFFRNNYYYTYSNNPEALFDSVKLVQADRAFWGSLREDGSIVIIKQDRLDKQINNAVNFITKDSAAVPSVTGKNVETAKVFYFPEVLFQDTTDVHFAYKPKSIGYRDYKFVLQTLTIPLKFRKAVDTIPGQVESGVSIGFASGMKWAYNWYSADKSFLGQKTNQLSFTLGGLLGASAIDVKAKVNAPLGFRDRKAASITYGGVIMIGFNNINLGFAVGTDRALGKAGKSGGWIYNKKIWTGIAVALDLIK